MAVQAEIKAVISAKDEASSVLSKFGSGFGSIAKGVAAGAAVAGAAVIGFGVASVAAFSESEDAAAQLNAVLKSTGGVAGITAESANELASSLQKVTKFSDEAILGGENLLLTFTNIGKDIFPQATEVMLDMSQALGQDVKSSAIQLGKALQDPILGVTALRRVGVNFNEAQQDVIKNLVETGRAGEAQAMILKELQTEFGGSAKAAGQTFSGQLTILENTFGDVMEVIGAGLVKTIQPFVKAIADYVTNHQQQFIDGFAVLAGYITVAFNALKWAYDNIFLPVFNYFSDRAPAILEAFRQAWAALQQAWAALQPALVDLWNTIQTQLLPVLQEFWDKNQNWIIPALKFMAEIIGGVILASILGFIGALKIIVEVISWVVSGITWLVEQFKAGFAWIKQGVTGLKDHFWENVGFIIGFFATLPIKIPFYIAAALIAAANFIRNMDWGAILSNIWNAFINLNHRIIDGFHDLVNRIRNIDWGSVGKSIANAVIGFIEGAINGAMKGIPGAPTVHIPRFARGVENFAGGLALVGERGPELVNLPSGSDVIPNNQIGGLSGSASNTTININVGMMTGSAIEQREAAMRIFENLQDIANTKGQTVAQMIGA